MENENEIVIHFKETKPLVTENFTFISLYDFQLTEYDLQKAHERFNETEEKRKKCLQELRKKLGNDAGMNYRTADDYLLRYIRHCKFDCEKAHKIIRNFYTIRMKYAEYFTIPTDLKTLFSRGFLTCLPYTDEEGRVLFWTNFKKWKIDEISIIDLIQMLFIYSDIITMNPKCQINGCLALWDFRGVRLKHMKLIAHPSMLWLLSNVLQDCYPMKFSGIVGIHCNKYVRACYNGIRYVLKQKVADRIKLLGSDINELHENINPHLLPKEYGGYLKENECSATGFAEKILENLKYLEYERTFGTKSDGQI